MEGTELNHVEPFEAKGDFGNDGTMHIILVGSVLQLLLGQNPAH